MPLRPGGARAPGRLLGQAPEWPEIEAIGLALQRLERAIRDLARRFGLTPDDLRLDLGPLGRLT